MEGTQRRMIAVAVFVSLFAVGMAGLLNYFKYRGTAGRIVEDHLVLVGRSIENSIQTSLELGMQLGDLGVLPELLERERAADDLVDGIDIFDMEGRPLYSTDRVRATRPAPQPWLDAAHKAVGGVWTVQSGAESAAGLVMENNFGLKIGYIALRYNERNIDEAAHGVARRLFVNGVLVFVGAALAAWAALMAVMRSLARDVSAVERALRAPAARSSAPGAHGLFGAAVRRFVETTRRAESEIAELRGVMQRENKK